MHHPSIDGGGRQLRANVEWLIKQGGAVASSWQRLARGVGIGLRDNASPDTLHGARREAHAGGIVMRLRDSLRKGMYLVGSLLVGKGVASEDQVQQALGEQERRKQRGRAHKRLGQLLIEMSAVSHEDLDQVLETQRTARAAAAVEEEKPRAVGQAAEAVTAVPDVIEAEVATPAAADTAAGDDDGETVGATADDDDAAAGREPADAPFIASAKGVVFHTRECLAAKKIAPTNQMQFWSHDEAEAAGKRACSKCC
jgi:hypothetical protein